jgi:hypothetical protein
MAVCEESIVLGAQLVPRSVSAAPPSASSVVSKTDTDNDNTLDLAEVKAAASAKFDALNKDADGTLSVQELKSKAARTLKGLTTTD